MRAVLIIALAGCVHRGQPVPISFGPNRELLVDVNINGAPLVLQLDTGSSTTALTPVTTQKLHLPNMMPFSEIGGDGAAGHIGKIKLVKLLNTRVGGHLVRYLPGAIVDVDSAHGSIDGVLGMDVLGRYATEIDLGRNQLALHRRDDDDWRSGDFVGIAYATTEFGQIVIEVTIDDRPALAIIDVGANRSYATPAAAPVRDDVVRVITEAIGVDGHETAFLSMPKVRVTLGGVSLVVPSLLVAQLPVFRRLLGDRPAIIIGSDALGGRRIVIDPQDRRVYLSRR